MNKLVTNVGSFAPLFDKHVPHLLEKIFFFLDYDSLTKCSEVCLVWAKLFNSTLYQNKLRRKYLAPWTTLKMILDRTREDTWSWDWVLGVSYMIRLSGAELRQVSFHDPYSEGTAGMRGTRELNNGRYFWEIHRRQIKRRRGLCVIAELELIPYQTWIDSLTVFSSSVSLKTNH